MRNRTLLVIALLTAGAMSLAPDMARPHSGGTNAEGCHTNRRTGEYHCHTRKVPAPGQITYCHVLHGESRCGYAQSTCSELVSRFGGYCRPQ